MLNKANKLQFMEIILIIADITQISPFDSLTFQTNVLIITSVHLKTSNFTLVLLFKSNSATIAAIFASNRYCHRHGTKYRVYNESEADSIAGLAIVTNGISII